MWNLIYLAPISKFLSFKIGQLFNSLKLAMLQKKLQFKRSYYLKWILISKWECTWKNATLTSSIFWVSLCNCLLAHKSLIIRVAMDGASDWFGNFSDNEYNFVLQKKKLGEMIPFRMGENECISEYVLLLLTWHLTSVFHKKCDILKPRIFFWKFFVNSDK